MAESLANSLVFPPVSGDYLVLPGMAIDGDTLSFFWLLRDHARLHGINAPELHAVDKGPGQKASEFLASILPKIACRARILGREKYGRALLTLQLPDGSDLSQRMVLAGHACVWDGKGPRP